MIHRHRIDTAEYTEKDGSSPASWTISCTCADEWGGHVTEYDDDLDFAIGSFVTRYMPDLEYMDDLATLGSKQTILDLIAEPTGTIIQATIHPIIEHAGPGVPERHKDETVELIRYPFWWGTRDGIEVDASDISSYRVTGSITNR